MKTLRAIADHLLYWGESYIVTPFILLLLWGSVRLVNSLTGRAPMEDAEAIVGWLMQACGICVVLILTGLTQRFLYGYRAHHRGTTPPPLADDVHDSCVTSFLLLLFSVLIFGLIR